MISEKKVQLKKNIDEMITLNKDIVELNRRLQALRNQKQKIEHETNQLLVDLDIENTTFKLNNFKIQQKKVNSYQSLSIKHIQNSLESYLMSFQVVSTVLIQVIFQVVSSVLIQVVSSYISSHFKSYFKLD